MHNLPISIEPSLLTDIGLSDLSELADELTQAYKTRQIFRTETEARISVLDHLHFPTAASKYWQCVREQTSMLENLSSLSFDYRRNELKIKRAQIKIDAATNELDAEEAQIDLDEAMFSKMAMRTVALDRVREIKMWSKLKSELNHGEFDAENVDVHQLLSYTTKFALLAANTNPTSMSADEYHNLFGQLQTAIARCQEVGVIDQLKANLPSEISQQLLN